MSINSLTSLVSIFGLTQAAVSFSLRSLHGSVLHEAPKRTNGRGQVDCPMAHPQHSSTHPHTKFVLYGGGGRKRVPYGGRASFTHAFCDVYSVILCPGSSFPFLLSPNCPRTAVRLPVRIANCVMSLLVAVRAIYPCNPFILDSNL
ncbi:hypothetical protein HOY80DRAFT_417485 [Tuber brumale]|nr:hypothetical protein HOY80DRAFT_417485 [Tuber brumale]